MSGQTTERVATPRARLRPAARVPHPRLRPAEPRIAKEMIEAKRAELFEGLITVSELAEIFQVHWRSIYGWCKSPGANQGTPLPSIRFGNRRLFDLAKVREWMLAKEVDRTPPPRPVGRPRKNTRT